MINLQEEFKKETKETAYDLFYLKYNEYYVEWLEAKIEQLMLGGVSVPKGTLRFHLEALTKEIEDIHNYGFDDVLSNYLKRNAL